MLDSSTNRVIDLRDVTKRFPPSIVAVDRLSLSLQSGRFLALLGPSGCGKSTTLRLLAGLESPDAGEIYLDGRPVAGSRWVAPEARRVGMVFQDYALFPHLTVAQNIGFPLNHLDRRGRRRRVEELIRLVGLEDTDKRYPHQVSGGQQQRVALARALASDPTVVLLDEPFSNLDAALRENTRREVQAILARAGATTILVTHDQEEAISLADRVAVMFAGRIHQVGTPEEIYLTPATRRIAEFVGAAYFVDGDAEGDVVACSLGKLPLAREAHGPVSVLLRPDALSLSPSDRGEARIVSRSFFGPYQMLGLSLPGELFVEARLPSTVRLPTEERIKVKVEGTVVAYPR